MTTDPLNDAAERLLAQVAEAVRGRRLPEATYRLQFHKGFTFRDATALVPYLRDLGVTHLYASPYLQARPGSMHGYDITNHQRLNPEVGTDADYEALVAALHEHGLGQIFDMVPNHMGVLGNENPWWNDVLENGPASPFAAYFDITWRSSPRPELHDRLLVPILGDPYGKALEAQQLRLDYAGGAFTIHYYDNIFPVSPCTYALILSHRLDELKAELPETEPALLEYLSILSAVGHLPGRTETAPEKIAERQREKEVVKRRLAALTAESDKILAFLQQNVAIFNGKAGEPASFDLLDRLLDAQAYRLSFWRVASDEINYRRFFDINELAALSMERPEVFDATHEFLFRLLREGKIDGLRIDHPDGLFDPKQYLERLQRRFVLEQAETAHASRPEQGTPWEEVRGRILARLELISSDNPLWRPLYVVVEKILGTGEPLPQDWPVYGTSGYEFLNVVNDLFVDPDDAKAFTGLYFDWGEVDPLFPVTALQKKTLTLQVSLSSELQMLSFQLDRLAQKNRWSRDFTFHSLRHALREIVAEFPVYRSYISERGVSERDRCYVTLAVNRARRRNPAITAALFTFVRDMLLLHYPETASEADRADQRRFVGKFQQVTAPVTAKGIEDTAFYIYNRLASLNEVGGDPGRFGLPPTEAHEFFHDRQASWPWSLSPLSTHDTKRGEDVRARLNVLSEIPDEWKGRLGRWRLMNETQRVQAEDELAPDPNEQYLLYQTLLGAWPMDPCPAEERAEFVRRVQAYMLKAVHEAKVHTSWINPNKAYDDGVVEFVARLLDEGRSKPFLDDFREFQRRISHYGLFNSLSQTSLRLTAPGVPDTYQGTELWDFSLVDPDNRRPVDYERRREMLGALRARLDGDRRQLARELVAAKEDGRIKIYLTHLALQLRRENPGLFADGAYVPLEAEGARKDHVFGFVRAKDGRSAAVVVPRFLTRLLPDPGDVPTGRVWEDTAVRLPGTEGVGRWRNVFTGETWAPSGGALRLAEVLGDFPVALLMSESEPRP